jgi:hypothetical protein
MYHLFQMTLTVVSFLSMTTMIQRQGMAVHTGLPPISYIDQKVPSRRQQRNKNRLPL